MTDAPDPAPPARLVPVSARVNASLVSILEDLLAAARAGVLTGGCFYLERVGGDYSTAFTRDCDAVRRVGGLEAAKLDWLLASREP